MVLIVLVVDHDGYPLWSGTEAPYAVPVEMVSVSFPPQSMRDCVQYAHILCIVYSCSNTRSATTNGHGVHAVG
jgi:hypothetical protein